LGFEGIALALDGLEKALESWFKIGHLEGAGKIFNTI
jgi:hypothetical protein